MLMRALIVAMVMSLATGEYFSPVFLWGVKSPAKSSLQTVTQENFADLLTPLLESHMVVAFQEEHLSSRDFLCHKSDSSDTCYAHLSGVSPKSYYASVENPVEALRTLTKSREYNIVDSNGKLQAPLECTPGKVTFVSFDDVTADDRADVLEAHDVAIADITKELDKCSVVYLYMSTPSNAKSRARRATAGEDYLFRQGNQFLIYWSQLSYNDGSGKGYQNVVINSMTVQNETAGAVFNVTLADASGRNLAFKITKGGDGYYSLSDLNFAGQKFYYTPQLNAPFAFSFHCGNLTAYTIPQGANPPPVASLKWNDLQFQAPFNPNKNLTFSFGDSWDCVPFFTPGILSGLFVTIILLSIIFVGICWMIDINTMDRFDDPKGKTITINASE